MFLNITHFFPVSIPAIYNPEVSLKLSKSGLICKVMLERRRTKGGEIV